MRVHELLCWVHTCFGYGPSDELCQRNPSFHLSTKFSDHCSWDSDVRNDLFLHTEFFNYKDVFIDMRQRQSSLLWLQFREEALVFKFIQLFGHPLPQRKNIQSFPWHFQHSKATSPGVACVQMAIALSQNRAPCWKLLASSASPPKRENTRASWTNSETCLTSSDEMSSINTPYLLSSSFQDWFTTEIFVSLKFKYMKPNTLVSVDLGATESSMNFTMESGH